MFLRFEAGAPFGFADDRVFSEQTTPQNVTQVLRARKGKDQWCPVIGLGKKGERLPAMARKVQDSGEGTCFLVYGGAWGLELKDPSDGTIWHEPFLLLPASGSDLQFST